MRTPHQAEWTNEAIDTYDDIIAYPYQIWGFEVAQKLIDQIDEIIILIEQNPTMYLPFPAFRKSEKHTFQLTYLFIIESKQKQLNCFIFGIIEEILPIILLVKREKHEHK